MATSSPVNFSLLDPTIASDQVALERNMALAQALRQQAMTPIDPNRQIGGVAYRVSPFEGLAKMLQGYSAKKYDEKNDADRMGMAQKSSDLIKALVGGGASDPSTASTAALTQGAMQGDVGPTNSNAVRMGMALQGGGQQGALSVTGNPKIDQVAMAFDPQGYMGTFLKGYEATDATKMARAAGMDPRAANVAALAKANTDGTILRMQQGGLSPQQIYAAVYGEAAKGADIQRRPEQMFSNAFTGERGFVPKIPEGANPVGMPAANGALPQGVAPMPGAAPIVQRNSQAASTGQSNGAIRDVTTSTGAVIPMRGQDAVAPQAGVQGSFRGDPAEIAASIAGIKDPQERANAQAAFDAQMRREGSPIKLGQSTADKEVSTEAGKTAAALPTQVVQTKQTITGLENALKEIDRQKKSGPGVSKGVNALAVLNNLGVPLAKGDVNGYQTLKKFLENSAASAAAAGGFTGSDARFEQFKAGQPNAETMNADALEGAIRYVLSQQDAALHQGNHLLRQSGGDANKLQSARQEWAKQYNPRFFEVQRLSPDAQRAAVGQMSPQEAAAFLAWRKAQK